MKHRLQTLLKHKLQWLVLLTALLGVSQGVWSTDLYLRGSFNSWGTSSKFVDSKVIIYLGAATHEFKVGEGGDSNWESYGVTDTEQNKMSCSVNSKTLTDSNDQNIKFTVSTAGYYIFTFVLSTQELTIDCCNNSLSENVVSVLEGTKICFYAGIDNDWDPVPGTVYLKEGSDTYSSSDLGSYVSGRTYRFAAFCLPSKTYSISNSNDWGGHSIGSSAAQGMIYGLYSESYGNNNISTINPNMSISTFKFDGSSGGSTKTVSKSETLTLYTACGTNEDPYGTSLEVQYYAKSAGGCYTLLASGDVDSNNENTKSGISVSGLAPGDYTLYALLTDKTNHRAYIIKAGSTLSLTVTSCTYPGDLTVSANNTTSSLTVCSGADVVISATGYESGYSYTLYRGNTSLETKSCSSCSSLVFTKDNPSSSSNTSVTYTIKAAQTNSGCETMDKGNKSVSIDAPSATGTIQGAGARCSTGSAKTLSLSSSSRATQYQWYSSSSASGTYSPISDADDATYSASPNANTYYKVEVKNGVCGWTTGLSVSPALVSVDQPSVAGTILGDGAVCEGKGNLSVDGNRGSVTWYSSDSESSGYSSTGTTASTYDATGITAKKYYKVYVKNGACDAEYSDPVLVSVGNIVKITVKKEGVISKAPKIYGWFNSNDKFLGDYPGTSTTGSGPYTLIADTKTCGTYNIIISDADNKNNKTNDINGLTGDMCFTVSSWGSNPGNCCSGVSAPSMTTTGTSNLNVCADGENTFSVNVTSGGIGTLTYQWFKTSEATATGGSSVTEALPLSKGGNEYTLQHTDVGTYNYYCLVRSGDGCSEAVKSTSSLISNVTVKETPHLSPSSITVKPYEPVSITSTNSLVEWSVSKINGSSDADPDSDYYYIYDETKRNVKFKGNSENSVYKVVAEPESGSDCEGVTTITVEDDPDEGC